jgi:hypothetical protein
VDADAVGFLPVRGFFFLLFLKKLLLNKMLRWGVAISPAVRDRDEQGRRVQSKLYFVS